MDAHTSLISAQLSFHSSIISAKLPPHSLVLFSLTPCCFLLVYLHVCDIGCKWSEAPIIAVLHALYIIACNWLGTGLQYQEMNYAVL